MQGNGICIQQQRLLAYRSAAGRISATLSKTMRRAGLHPVVIKDTLHHTKVDPALNVYDKASTEDIRAGLKVASKELLGSDAI
jgi:hypothetical protein